MGHGNYRPKNMQFAQVLGILVPLFVIRPSMAATSQSDIVWPTYDQVRHVADGLLNCRALDNEISHTGADVSLLHHAQVRVEDVLHSAFDLERYGGGHSPDGGHVQGGPVHGKEAYATARGQIVASLRVAEQRRDWLVTLKPNCKPVP